MKNLHFYYKTKVINYIMKKFNFLSIMQVPKIKKVTLNIGLGNFVNNKIIFETVFNNLKIISGQKPIFTKSKKSISGFNLRKGMNVGCKVTLRNKNMWIFIEKLIKIIIPRIRDFRGLTKKSFDKYGNYSIGLREYYVFPEIIYSKYDKNVGMDIIFTINSNSININYFFLKKLGFPFN